MSIYREWTDRYDSVLYGPEPLGIWITRQAALDRLHYAEVEAKHTAEVTDLRKDLKEALDYQVHLQRGWGQANAERDKAREALKSRCADGCEKTLSSLYRAEIERDEARCEAGRWKLNHGTAVKQRDEARAQAAHWRPVGVDACWKDAHATAVKERDKAHKQVSMIREDMEYYRKHFYAAKDKIKATETERNEARAEIEKLKTGNKDLADVANAYRLERNELGAKLAEARSQRDSEQTDAKFFSEAVQDGRLQRPIGRNEHDRRISRLEAKVANLELGGAR